MDPTALKEQLIDVLGQITGRQRPRMPNTDRHHQTRSRTSPSSTVRSGLLPPRSSQPKLARRSQTT